jgi:hypothetical protein
MSDGNMGAGAGGNALYNISQTSIPSNLFKLGYVDENSELRLYPSSNTQYSNTYTTLSGTDSVGNNISGGTSGNTTVSACQTSCNNNADCAGFSFSTSNNTCSLKNSSMYPNDKKQPNTNVDLYVRNEQPITPPRGISNVVKNIDTISYQNYIVGSNQTQNYGLSSATSAEKDKLSELETLMDQLSSQLNSLTGKFSNGSYDIQTQLQTNSQGMKDYAQGIVTANKKVTNFDTNVENMLKDSDIVVLQKNYNYLFWSILAVGTVLISMNIAKKGTS